MNELLPSTIRARLQARIARSAGEDFRTLFARMFDPLKSNAVPIAQIRSNGRIDRAVDCAIDCDWYETGSGRYYHVHAPESFDDVSAVGSIVDVLQGLLCGPADPVRHPRGITEFHFVVNDAYRMKSAACPAMYGTLEAYRQKFRLRRCRTFLANDLEDALMALAPDRLQAIAGYVPDFGQAGACSRELIAQVLAHIAAMHSLSAVLPNRILPEPELSPPLGFVRLIHTEPWLAQARCLAASVQQALASQRLCAIDIRMRLQALDQNSRLHRFRDIPGGPTRDDQRLEYLVDAIAPAGADPATIRALQAAAIAVIGFYAAGPGQFDAAASGKGPGLSATRAADDVLRGLATAHRTNI